MNAWQGKVAVVTGASSGLGRAIATALVDRGASVVLAARGADKLEAAAAELRARGGNVLAVPTDITSAEDRGKAALSLSAGTPHVFRLAPFEVLTLDVVP